MLDTINNSQNMMKDVLIREEAGSDVLKKRDARQNKHVSSVTNIENKWIQKHFVTSCNVKMLEEGPQEQCKFLYA